MLKKIIAVIVIALLLAAAFFASYTLSMKYWDKLAPYIQLDTPAAVPEAPTAAVSTTVPTTVPTTTAETTTAPVTATDAAAALAIENIVEMPTDETWKLVLVNRHNQISEAYVPVLAPIMDGSTVQVDLRMTEAFQKMYGDALTEGVTLTPVAGYISKELQNSLYQKKVEDLLAQGMTAESAAKLAAETILPAGCSEDNLGVSVCIGMQLDSFSQTEAYQWLQNNAYKYGFIERYTAAKKTVTEVDARPWYWRYVGTDAAELMRQSGQCLEEFLQG